MRVAIIGSEGKMGGYHVKACIDLGHDVERYDLRFHPYSDYKLMPTEEIDAVIIATPTPTHFKIAKYFIECKGNIKVFIEKPMCESSVDAYFLVKLAERKNVQLMVGHIERFNPIMTRFMYTGGINNIRDITTIRRGYTPEVTSNIISDVMIHDIDNVCCILNYKKVPHVIYSIIKGKHYAQAIINYDGILVTRIVDRKSKHITRKIQISTNNEYTCMNLLKKKITVHNDIDKQPCYMQQFNNDALRAELRAFFDGYDNAEQAYRNVKTCENIIRGSIEWKKE